MPRTRKTKQAALTENQQLLLFLLQTLKERARLIRSQVVHANEISPLEVEALATTFQILDSYREYLTHLENLLKISHTKIPSDFFLR